jgi:uncharacterized membrane protein
MTKAETMAAKKKKSKGKKQKPTTASELSPKEKVSKLYRCVERLSKNLSYISTTIASETVTPNPQAMWRLIESDVFQVVKAARECPSEIDCSIVYTLDSIIQSVGHDFTTAEMIGHPENVNTAIESGFSRINSLRGRLDKLAGKVAEFVRTGSSDQELVESTAPTQSVKLTDTERDILRCLHEKETPMIQSEIAQVVDYGDGTIKKSLQILERWGYVSRPRGKRKGYANTDKGEREIK